jgi:hypothetical protein
MGAAQFSMRPLLGSVLALSLFAVGCASQDGERESVAVVKSAIQGGTEDTQHAYAVGIYDAEEGALCSGALIAPNLVLTARHCVAPVSEEVVNCMTARFGRERNPRELRVTTDAQMRLGDRTGAFGTRLFIPKDAAFCGNDIAIIELSSNLADEGSLFVTPAIEAPMTDRGRYGLSVTAIGYGVTSPSGDGGGTRRIRQNIAIQCIPGDPEIPCGKPQGVEPTEFVTGDGTCQGDSGSSAYEQGSFDRGSPVTLGVLSRGGQNGDTCLGAVYTRTDQFRELVVAAALQGAKDGGYAAPAWAHAQAVTQSGPGIVELGSLGVACTSNDQCSSQICATSGQAYVCSQACQLDEKDSCPGGFSCVKSGDDGGGYCFERPSGQLKSAAGPSSEQGGCAVGSAARGGDATGLLLLGAAMLSVGRRRRSRRRP